MERAAQPIALDSSDGEAWWFLGTLATIKVGGEDTNGRFSLFEVLFPRHAAPPVHKHPEDETFYVVDGDLTVWLDGVPRRCSTGSIAFFPRGAAHTFLVHSDTARLLTLSTPAGIERLVRLIGEPALERRLPGDDRYPTREAIDAALAACGVEVLGPPPEPARS